MIPKAARPLVVRTAAFLVICLLYSGIIGSRIIGNGILSSGHFEVYGGLGKAALFGVVAFGLLLRYRGKGASIDLPAWRRMYALWLVLSVVAAIGAWFAVSRLIAGQGGTVTILAHLLLWLSVLAAGLGSFGWPAVKKLTTSYRAQLAQAAAIAAVFFAFLTSVYAIWKPLAGVVLHAVRWMFGLIGVEAWVDPPRTLIFDKFGVEIAQYCSGIESIALFSGFFAIVALLDWRKFNHRRLAMIFLPALLVLFLFNIVRVFGIIALAYYWNPDVAFDLFHTYAGMVFFIIYSGLFWWLCYGWLLAKRPAQVSNERSSK